MIVETVTGVDIDGAVIQNYFRNLVNLFFKILPMREDNEPSVVTYMESLQGELLGCKALIEAINNDSSFLSLVAILQFLIDNQDASHRRVRREVFRAISICNKLAAKYSV